MVQGQVASRYGVRWLEVPQPAELLLDFAEQGTGQGPEGSHESAVVDGSTLINHDLTFLPVAGGPPRENDSQEILAGEAGGARQHPSGRMPGFVQQVGLDYQHRPDLAGFGAEAGIEVREVQQSALDPHSRSSPSAVSGSKSFSSAASDSRVERDAFR